MGVLLRDGENENLNSEFREGSVVCNEKWKPKPKRRLKTATENTVGSVNTDTIYIYIYTIRNEKHETEKSMMMFLLPMR